MEIIKDDGEGTEEDESSKSCVCSESSYHKVFDNYQPDLKETIPPEEQGDPNSIVGDLYNQLEVEKDDYEFERIFDHYFNDGILFLKERYVRETLGEDNTMEVPFLEQKKDFPVELARYIRNYVVETSRREGHFNAWAVNVLKVHTRDIRYIYRVKDISRVYRL